jgi:hypothetical protein
LREGANEIVDGRIACVKQVETKVKLLAGLEGAPIQSRGPEDEWAWQIR